jgi:hypothetical protein
MNKKLLICGAIATGLLLTACVKKEAPKEEEQVEVVASEVAPVETAQFENLEAVSEPVIEETPQTVEVIREETPNTTTEIRREVRPAEPAAPAAEAPKAQDAATNYTPKNNTGTTQSEEDAVNDAIAAAMPALEN